MTVMTFVPATADAGRREVPTQIVTRTERCGHSLTDRLVVTVEQLLARVQRRGRVDRGRKAPCTRALVGRDRVT